MKSSLAKKILFGIGLPLILILAPIMPQNADLINVAHAAAPQCSGGTLTTNSDGSGYLCDNGFSLLNSRFGVPGTVYDKYNTNGDYIGSYFQGPNVPTPFGFSSLPSVTIVGHGETASCSGLTSFFINPITCVWRAINVGIGAALISLTAWLLGVIGLLFDWLVNNTVVLFATSFYTQGVADGVNAAWSAFRDIANILIIGMFVFIAISIILGISEYGQKKYIARILIIAVLINFSLLFTKMIVDFSNFTAKQFYDAAVISGLPSEANISTTNITTNGANPVSGFANTGIAGKFIAMTGVTGVLSSTATLWNVAETQQSGWLALLHGVFAATLFLGAALVLLYGSYILLVRALVIVFLLLTSSLAFASYLIPNKEIVSKGWTLWWSSLIKTAVLAPLLMIFLWATSKIIDALGQGNGVKLADIATNANASNIAVLFNYLIVLGLLFASFKVANSLSNSIAGFNFPAMIAANTVGLASNLAAPVMRFTAGRFAAGQAGAATKRAKELRTESGMAIGAASDANTRAGQAAASRQNALSDRASALTAMQLARRAGDRTNAKKLYADATRLKGDAAAQKRIEETQRGVAEQSLKDARELEAKVAPLMKSATRYGRVADSKMNVMDTKSAQTIVKTGGLAGVFTGGSGKGTRSYQGIVDERAKAAAAVAAKLTPSGEEREKIRIDAEKKARGDRAAQKAQLEAITKAARTQMDAAQELQERAQKSVEDKIITTAQNNGIGTPGEHRDASNDPANLARRDILGNELKDELRSVLGSVKQSERAGLEASINKASSSKDLESLRKEVVQAVADPQLQKTVEADLKQSTGARESEMRHEEARINGARESILNAAKNNAAVQNAATNERADLVTKTTALRVQQVNVANASAKVGEFDQNTKKAIEDAVKQAEASVGLAAENISKEIGRTYGTVLQRVLGSVTGINEKVGNEVQSRYKKSNTRNARLLADLRDAEKEDGGGPPSPPTP